MKYFFETSDSIPDGVGFPLFGNLHLAWLVVCLATILVCCFSYRRLSIDKRRIWRYVIASLLLADELFKHACLIAVGKWAPEYLPLHLCSINIFVIVWHALKPGELSGNFLYTVCIPGAMAALLFPSWSKLPLVNFMHLHSVTVHILLVLYPVVLTAAGDIKPNIKFVPKCLLILLVMATGAYLINPVLDSNFFFMNRSGSGNPLYWFEVNFGNHLYGFPPLVAAVVALMHGPRLLAAKLRK